jgi:hypothetical protein
MGLVRRLSWVVVVAACGACSFGTYSGEVENRPVQVPPGGSTSEDAGVVQPTDLPCEVAAFLSADCLLCHGPVLANGAPSRLDGLAALRAPSISEPSKSNGQLALERMQSMTSPMPPPPYERASAIQISQFASWVTGGMLAGSCVPPSDAGAPPIQDGGVGGGGPSDAGVSGDLPCDVADVLTTSCTLCHGSPPTGGAPMALTTLAQLRAPSPSNASVSTAQACVQRMASTTSPMPPPPAAPVAASKQSAFAAWVSAGMQAGSCTVDAGTPDPVFSGPPTCTSGTYWTRGNHESPDMHPGLACIACHSRGEGPDFAIAGTAYPSGHEYDDCYGSAARTARIDVTDSRDVTRSFTANSAGNFFGQPGGGWPVFPIRAQIVFNGRTRAMAAAVDSGDCNSCHTLQGTSGAPGRIALP